MSVLTASTGVGRSDGRKLADAVNVKHLDLLRRQLGLDGGTGGRDVLEGGGGGLVRSEGARELVDERVRVERVEEVDVAGRARQDCEARSLGVSCGDPFPTVRLHGRSTDSPVKGSVPSVT